MQAGGLYKGVYISKTQHSYGISDIYHSRYSQCLHSDVIQLKRPRVSSGQVNKIVLKVWVV